ncbi:bifunctional DNA-formamidopyrimidine glycosylase/DNA-(apurinic or apyrimidinic site) lyase [Brachybacterium halotolerans subsp. kimchii]|uniref:bifunctional DNA-formamidopyrimidine glycosylase/DNA-(apurinic or apyrimidinic site) lyase n=1 Tax=Brachybacterium halotolerans TaxID=2795215 RepID=UPI001E55CB4F|nr:bifunctional DNA-formamidopyrimidine glycosylase/DNA-(apurinic or apyrimidinic site) lyase [Brachybacterium halotolerans]UEJ83019.1 bifunctional DNA-formamidopyrimidine glycosylase/DNA-(apurinic or apyrimidinic site) lyase [Brachybacterium halotolerans subsp. kimchii]
MPELPEVEVVRRGLAPHVDGRVITRVDVHEPRSLRRQIGGPDAFVQAVTGARVARLERRGKFLWWRLQDERGDELGEALMTHLGMSGQMRVRGDAADVEARATVGAETAKGVDAPSDPAPRGEGPASDPHRHRRIVLHLDDGAQVDFVDQRIFGGLWTSALEQDADGLPATPDSIDDLLPADVVGIGRDLLDPAQDREAVIAVMRARRAPIKALLLDQSLVSGIGNIYADEGLWAARTRYDAPGETLTRGRAGRVLDGAEAVMRRALDVGGTSFDDLYVNVDGRSGYFARSLAAYGRAGEPCPRCGTIIRRSVLQQRSCFFCPNCQRRA